MLIMSGQKAMPYDHPALQVLPKFKQYYQDELSWHTIKAVIISLNPGN
jgi:hypothetical protein